MVDIVTGILAVVDHDDMPDDFDNIFEGQCPLLDADIETQPLVQLVTADAAQVITSGIEEEAFNQFPGVVKRGKFARVQFLIYIEQGFFFVLDIRFAFHRGQDVVVVVDPVFFLEKTE